MTGRQSTRVAVLYNAPALAPDHPDYASEADVVEVAGQVVELLKLHHLEAWLVPASPPIRLVFDRLTDPMPDVVFNLIEGFAGSSGGEAHITSLLELLDLPYTGCPPEAQTLCHSKARTKALLRGLELPTAPFAVVRPGEPVPNWEGPWPVLIKPDAEDASLGIDQSSVVKSPESLIEAVVRLGRSYGSDILIEAYLPGREFNVGVLALSEPQALPIAEIVYDVPQGAWPILTYAAKWDLGSVEDRNSRPNCPAVVDRRLGERLSSLAVEAFRATGCRDYARVDFRLDLEGSPMILEVNPNPDIGPNAGWARALKASGLDYGEVLAQLVFQAQARRHFDARA